MYLENNFRPYKQLCKRTDRQYKRQITKVSVQFLIKHALLCWSQYLVNIQNLIGWWQSDKNLYEFWKEKKNICVFPILKANNNASGFVSNFAIWIVSIYNFMYIFNESVNKLSIYHIESNRFDYKVHTHVRHQDLLSALYRYAGLWDCSVCLLLEILSLPASGH